MGKGYKKKPEVSFLLVPNKQAGVYQPAQFFLVLIRVHSFSFRHTAHLSIFQPHLDAP